jgi:hypothetical protein
MRKKTMVMVVLAAFLSTIGAPMTFAQVGGPSGTATVAVPSFLEFGMQNVYRLVSGGGGNPFTDGTLISPAAFNFGTLSAQNDAQGNFLYMKGQYYFVVIMIATTSGRRYKITERGDQLHTAGGVLMARESVLLIPDYIWVDQLGGVAQGAPPAGASVGSVTTACSSTDSLVYQSDGGGLGRMVRGIIAITGPGAGATYPTNYSLGHDGDGVGQGTPQQYTAWRAVTKDQPTGTYTGSMTFTLTLN